MNGTPLRTIERCRKSREGTGPRGGSGNQVVLEAFARTELVGALVSEELDEPRQMAGGPEASYILCVDPLDGSSNSDVNGVIATIFGVYRPSRRTTGPAGVQDLQSGRDQVAAGYIMYGPSTMLVYTTGDGVHGFTLDHDIGEFVLSHPNLTCPARGPYYSANVGNDRDWDSRTRAYVRQLAETHSLRYTGALVADLHRCLIEGGVYLYPADRQNAGGKLRLTYECAPLAFVVEQAGGAASIGGTAVLDVTIDSPHQRVPFAIGSRQEVALFDRFSSDAPTGF